jgi:ERF superfamily
MCSIRTPAVQQSSESVAALAAALAKAQAQLVNPEKSLTATISTGRAGETQRTFRYAPLSSGLEIVRKSLSEQEIAVIQTTAVDPASRVLTLTTMLAHASGQWISSQWPVCPLADVASPHRMGAALTYARRYSLFTLVGIAGEDDLDGPDLCTPAPAVSPSVAGAQVPPKTSGNGRMREAARAASSSILPAEQSAALRDRLISEIAGLRSQDIGTAWAREALPLKNTLTAGDARLVETAFALKQSAFSLADAAEPSQRGLPDPVGPAVTPWAADASASLDPVPAAERLGTSRSADGHEPGRIDKSVLTISTPKRYRNKEHLRFVAHQPCVLCGRKPAEAHHIRFVQPRALGRKASDEFAIPLCRSHHRALHRAGDEKAWWQQAGIDPVKIARKLWKLTRMHEPRIRPAVLTQNAAAELPAQSDGQVPSGPATT